LKWYAHRLAIHLPFHNGSTYLASSPEETAKEKLPPSEGATSSIEPEPTIPQSECQPNKLIVNLQDKSQPDKLDSGDDMASAADTNDLPDHSSDQQWHDTSTSACNAKYQSLWQHSQAYTMNARKLRTM
jgi:hypothetical protein